MSSFAVAQADEKEWDELLRTGDGSSFESTFQPVVYTVLRDIILLRRKHIAAQQLDAFQLPPVSGLRNHLLRTQLVMEFWCGATIREREQQVDITTYGFAEDGAPLQCSESDAALWGINFEHCTCTRRQDVRRCVGKRCPCKRWGKCSGLCRCVNASFSALLLFVFFLSHWRHARPAATGTSNTVHSPPSSEHMASLRELLQVVDRKWRWIRSRSCPLFFSLPLSRSFPILLCFPKALQVTLVNRIHTCRVNEHGECQICSETRSARPQGRLLP